MSNEEIKIAYAFVEGKFKKAVDWQQTKGGEVQEGDRAQDLEADEEALLKHLELDTDSTLKRKAVVAKEEEDEQQSEDPGPSSKKVRKSSLAAAFEKAVKNSEAGKHIKYMCFYTC